MIEDNNILYINRPFDNFGDEFKQKHQIEMNRIYHLPSQWLGAYTLKIARQARSDHPEITGDPISGTDVTPIGTLFWWAIPELCRRLGAPKLMPVEENNNFSSLSDEDLRQNIGHVARSHTIFGLNGPKSMPMWMILAPPFIGNPLVIALDRLVEPDTYDYFSNLNSRFTGKNSWIPENIERDKIKNNKNENNVISIFK